MLDQVVYNLKRLRHIKYMMPEFHKWLHKTFKRNYETLSKRPNITIKDTLWTQDEKPYS